MNRSREFGCNRDPFPRCQRPAFRLIKPCAIKFTLDCLLMEVTGANADWRSESAFAVDSFGGAAQLWSSGGTGNMSITRLTMFCCSVLLLSSGCSFAPPPYPKLRITNQTDKSNPPVDLSMSAEDLFRISKPGYYLRRSFRSGEANCFILYFKGSQTSASSIGGSYQYYSEKPQPLELAYLTNNFAVLVPRRNILAKPPPASLVYAGFMKFGTYKLDIQYQADGHIYSCHFNVDYFRNNTPELHGVWELRDVN
jgi:hypothetical protein